MHLAHGFAGRRHVQPGLLLLGSRPPELGPDVSIWAYHTELRPLVPIEWWYLVLCQRFDFGFTSISEHLVFVCRRTTCVFGGRAASPQVWGLTLHLGHALRRPRAGPTQDLFARQAMHSPNRFACERGRHTHGAARRIHGPGKACGIHSREIHAVGIHSAGFTRGCRTTDARIPR
jgi:hypothetical protein